MKSSCIRNAGMFLLVAFCVTTHAGESVSLFDGKSFDGWEGDTTVVWRVENGELVGGSLGKKQKNNDFLATRKSYENFDLRLKIKLLGTEGFVNSGVQFRSQRVPNSYEVSGFQGDFGAGFDGALYDESRRNKVLTRPSADVLTKASVGKGEWTDYRIRAEGPHIQIWLNGVQTVDYTESDPNIARTGILALQLHGGAIAEVHFKDLFIEELPASPPPGLKPTSPLSRMTETIHTDAPIPPFEAKKFSIRPNEVIVFAGPENMVVEQRSGWIETVLTAAAHEAKPRFRHMGWEGDTVYRQNRMDNWGSWQDNLAAVDATLIVAWFGQTEALDTTRKPEEFSAAYATLLDAFVKRTPRVVVISPAPFEKPAEAYLPDNTVRNEVVHQYAESARQLAEARGLVFVDLYSALSKRSPGAPPLTRDGIHFKPEGMHEVARLIAAELKLPEAGDASEPLRTEIVEKNRIWFDCWRCMNWAFAYSDRTTQPFAKATTGFPAFVEELTKFRPLVNQMDARVHAVANAQTPPALPALEATPVAPPARTPEEQLKDFTIYPGLSANLFADEHLGLIKPVQIRWDNRGRLWALCIPSYPQLLPGQKPGDYLLVLEDTDGDGKADKATRYVEGLVMPMGFEFDGHGGVYICESTQLVHYSDTKGTGKADSRQVVLSGFGTGDSHQMINSLRWGPDGNLWFTQGYHIWSYVETPHGVAELNRSGVWRFNPRTMRLDGFFNESTTGLNCWGVTFDEAGQIFHGSGADTSFYYSTPGIIPTLHVEPYKHDFCVSRGKGLEPEFIFSRHLPDDLQGALMKSTFFTSQVSLFKLSDEGSGFKSTAMPDLMATKGTDFRPVETRVGPDGAIYVCDWLNPIIGHYQASYRDPRRDRTHGRIWRLTATDRPLVERPRLEKMSATELLEQLRLPERWTRDHAREALYALPKEQVLPVVDAWVAALDPASPQTEKLLYEVSGIYCAHESPRPALVDRFLASSDFRWRCWGLRLVGQWGNAVGDPLARVTRGATDEHPRVRLEAVVAASYLGTMEALKAALLVLDKPRDFYLDYALTQCIHALSPVWRPALAAGTLDFGGRMNALVHLLRVAGAPSTAASGPQATGSGEGAALIRKLSVDQKLPDETREALLTVLVESGRADDMRFALDQGGSKQKVVTALTEIARLRNRIPSGNLDEALETLLASPDATVRAGGYRLAGAWKRVALKARAKSTAESTTAPATERTAALETYAALAGAESVPMLLALSHDQDAAVQVSALAAAVPLSPAEAASRAAELLAKIENPDDAGPLLRPFLAKNGGAEALAKAIQNNKPNAKSAAAELQWLARNGHEEPVLREALNSAVGITGSALAYSPELIAGFVADAKAKGDAVRGQKLFHMPERACLNCHKVGNEGATIGPELTSVARALTPEFIVESVLWPDRQVKEGYLLVQVATKDGRRLQGFKSAETTTTLTLREITSTETVTLNKSEIQKRRDAGTPMPYGLTDGLTRDQLADLFRYLMELGK